MKPSCPHITAAVRKLGLLRFFPSDVGSREAIMDLIERMVGDVQQLDWLVATMIDRVGEWHGPVELRGVFCSRFKPGDNIEADCAATPGFTPGAIEAEYGQLTAAESARQIAGYKQKLLEAPADYAPLEESKPAKKVPPPYPAIPSTPVRTPEERAALEQEVLEKVLQLQKTEKGQIN